MPQPIDYHQGHRDVAPYISPAAGTLTAIVSVIAIFVAVNALLLNQSMIENVWRSDWLLCYGVGNCATSLLLLFMTPIARRHRVGISPLMIVIVLSALTAFAAHACVR